MKSAPRSRVLVVICCTYLLFVGAAFLFGLLVKDDFGVSFMPGMLLTLPRPFVLLWIARTTQAYSPANCSL
jgi:hypothetical protein